MTAMQMHFTIRYGLNDASMQDWQLEQPVTQPWCSPIESAWKRLLEVQALVHHQKPGGYNIYDLKIVAAWVNALRHKGGHPRELELVVINKEIVPHYLGPHMKWLHQLKPVLAR